MTYMPRTHIITWISPQACAASNARKFAITLAANVPTMDIG
jgi:hypothetical protein